MSVNHTVNLLAGLFVQKLIQCKQPVQVFRNFRFMPFYKYSLIWRFYEVLWSIQM